MHVPIEVARAALEHVRTRSGRRAHLASVVTALCGLGILPALAGGGPGFVGLFVVAAIWWAWCAGRLHDSRAALAACDRAGALARLEPPAYLVVAVGPVEHAVVLPSRVLRAWQLPSARVRVG